MVNFTFSKNLINAVVLSICFLFAISATAAPISSMPAGGDWSNPGTWAGGIVPGAGDDVTIVAGAIVNMDVPGACLSLTIDGTIDWTSASTNDVGVGGIIINAGGDISGFFSGILTTAGNIFINSSISSPLVTVSTQTTLGLVISGSGTFQNLDISTSTVNTGNISVLSSLSGTDVLTNDVGASLTISGTSSLAGLTASANPNTVNYDGFSQSIVGTDYHNLILSGSGNPVLPLIPINISGDFNLSGAVSTTANAGITVFGNLSIGFFASFDGGAGLTHNINADWSNDGVFVPSTSVINFAGPVVQSIYGSVSSNFLDLIINNANGITLGNNITVSGTLLFTVGTIATGINTVSIVGTGIISGAGVGAYVYGNLEKNINIGDVVASFEIGDAANYVPVDLSLNAVSAGGSLTVVANDPAADHASIVGSDIDDTKSVNRTWTIANSGGTLALTSFDATFNFMAGDIDGGANTAIFVPAIFNGIWNYPSFGTQTATSTQATFLTLSDLGDFQIAEPVPLSIATNPSSQTICDASPVTFTSTASGYKPSMQWEVSTDGGFSWLPVPGEINSNYSFTVAIGDNNNQYHLIFTNPAGTITSSDAILTVDVPSAIAGTASMDQTICVGNPANINLVGETGTIQWQESTDNIIFNDMLGETANALNITPGVTSYYQAAVTVGVCPAAISNVVTITVDPLSVSGVASGDATICLGSATNINLAGETGTIQWQESTDNVVFNDIPGETFNLLTVSPGFDSYYQAVVTSGTCSNVTSNVITITVETPSAIAGTASMDQAVCIGNSANINLAGETGTIQWQESTDNIVFNDMPGETFNLLTVSPAVVSYYQAAVTVGVCPAAISNVVTITVDPLSVAGVASGDATICSGTATNITLAGETGTIQWQESTDNIVFNDMPGETFNLLTVSPGITSYYQAVVTSGTCSNVTSNVVTITVVPPSVAGVASMDQAVCVGNSANITLAGETGTIQWQESTDNIVFNDMIGETFNLLTVTPGLTSYYQAVVTNGICSNATSNVITITVDPLSMAGVATGDATICSGSSTNINLAGETGTIQWQESTDNIVFNDMPGETFNLLTVSPGITSYYQAVVTSGTCSNVTSNVITITVETPSAIAGTASMDQTICVGNPANINLVGETGTIQWQESTDNIIFNDMLGETANALNITPGVTSYYQAAVTVGVCPAAISNVVTITVDPLSVSGVASGDATICLGSATNINLAGETGTIQWQESTDNIVFNDIPGETFNLLTVSPGITSYYQAVVTSGTCSNVTSNVITITVETPSAIAGTASMDQAVCIGNSANINLAGETGTIQWQESTDNIVFNDMPGETFNLLTVSPAVVSYYQAAVTVGVCPAAISNVVTITVDPLPVSGIASMDQSICLGSSATINLAGETGTIQWQESTDNIVFNDMPGETTNILIVTAGVTSYYQAVVSSGTCSNVTSNVVTINILPLPDANVTTGGPTTFCAGGTITLSASAVPGNIYQWSNSMTTDNIIVSSSGNYTLTVTDINGCSLASTPVTVSVNSAPSAIINTSSGTNSMCQGETMTLTADPSVGNTYIWSTTETTPSIIVNQSNSYFVTITNSFSCSVVSNPVTISVMPLPTVEVFPFDTTICQGTSIGLSASGAISYQWLPTNSLDTAAGANVIASPTATTTYLITGTASNGCTSQTSRIISVREAPTAPVVSNNGPVCLKDSIKLYASIVNNAAYQWTGPAGFNLQLRDPSKIANTLADSGDYSLIITVDGCNSAPAITHVSVKPLPVANGSSNSPVCEGASLNLTANAVAGATYSWTGPNGFSTSDQNPTISNVNVLNSGLYRLRVISNGCRSLEKVFSGTVKPLPNAEVFSDHGNTLCEGKSVQLSVIDGTSFTWSNGGNTQTITVSTPGSYRVTVNLNGCSKASDNFVIYQVPNPPVPIITEEQGLLMSSSTIGNKWYKDNDFIYNEVYQTYRPLQDGMYKVIATDENGCYSESAYYNFLYFPVGISSIAGMQSFNIFPNPASGTVNLAYSLDKPARVKVEITNLTGQRLLLHPEEKQEAGEQHILLNLENLNLTAGIYQILLSENGKTSSVRLIVNK